MITILPQLHSVQSSERELYFPIPTNFSFIANVDYTVCGVQDKTAKRTESLISMALTIQSDDTDLNRARSIVAV